MSVFVLFFVELMTMRFAKFGHDHSHSHGHDQERGAQMIRGSDATVSDVKYQEGSATELGMHNRQAQSSYRPECPSSPFVPGDDHLSHARDHTETRALSSNRDGKTFDPESYGAQMTAVFILEFGKPERHIAV